MELQRARDTLHGAERMDRLAEKRMAPRALDQFTHENLEKYKTANVTYRGFLMFDMKAS